MPGDPLHYANLWRSLVPVGILKSLSAAELEDRVLYAEQLSRKASDPRLSAGQRAEAKDKAQRVMSAPPRATVEREAAAKIAKAAQLGDSSAARALRRQAQDLLDANPPAPRRAGVRKQDAGDALGDGNPIPVFDQFGNLRGVVLDPSQLTPFNSAYAPAQQLPGTVPQDDGMPGDCGPDDGQVMKSGKVVVYDQERRPYAVDSWNVHTRGVRKSAPPTATAASYSTRPDGTVDLFDQAGKFIGTFAPKGHPAADPTAQARNTGPVTAGGTTGMGQPRATGPAAALPADGPQAARPGDVPDRAVVKAGWVDVHTARGKLAGVIKSAHLIQPTPGAERNVRADGGRKFCAVHDAAGRRVGYAYRANLRPTRVAKMAAVLKSAGVDVSGPHVFAPDALSAEGSCVCGQAPGDSLHREMVAKSAARAGSRAASPQPPAVRVAKAAGAVRNTAITWPDWLVS